MYVILNHTEFCIEARILATRLSVKSVKMNIADLLKRAKQRQQNSLKALNIY